jgi:hypothetical protein
MNGNQFASEQKNGTAYFNLVERWKSAMIEGTECRWTGFDFARLVPRAQTLLFSRAFFVILRVEFSSAEPS